MSIKTFVFNCLDRGMTANEAWEAARGQYYPLRIVGWGYVLKLSKEYEQRANAGSVR